MRLRWCVLAVVAACWAEAAWAGTYAVRSCGAAPSGGIDDAWTFQSTNPVAFVQLARACPPASSDRPWNVDDPPASAITGIAAWTQLLTPLPHIPRDGDRAEFTLTAPAGTTITAVTIRRRIGKDDQQYVVYGRADDQLLPGETCSIPPGHFTCDVSNGPGSPAVTHSGLDASEVAWGIECPGAGGCGTGATLHSAWVAIYSSVVTIDDPTPPTGVTLDVAGSGWRRSTITAAGSATDATGIRGFRWYVDGAPHGGEIERPGGCDHSRVVPCPDAVAVAVALDTASLGDGSHSVRLAAVDAGGNEALSAPVVVDVDNTPPAAPADLDVSGGGTSPGFAIAWTDPPGDGAAPVTELRWRACRLGDGACLEGSTPARGGRQRLDGLALPHPGTYDVTVWAIDAAGNGAPTDGATARIAYAPPAPGGTGGGSGGGSGGGGSRAGGPAHEPDGRPGDAGHHERPPSGEPTPTPPGPAAGPVHRRSPALAIRSARLARARRTVVVRGSADAALRGTVTVTLRARLPGTRRTVTATGSITGGRLRATVRVPRRWVARARARARAIAIRVTFDGDARFAPATARHTIRVATDARRAPTVGRRPTRVANR